MTTPTPTQLRALAEHITTDGVVLVQDTAVELAAWLRAVADGDRPEVEDAGAKADSAEQVVLAMEASLDQTRASLRNFLSQCEPQRRDRVIRATRAEYTGRKARQAIGSQGWFRNGCVMIGVGVVLADTSRYLNEASNAGGGA